MATVGNAFQLTIRCAMQSFPDHNLECPADWSVLELKKHLSQTCASKPDPTRQRLIYAGRCLDNGQKVRDVLAQRRDGVARGEVAETQVIHMVYIGGKTSASGGTQNTSAAAAGTAGEGLRHRANNGRPNPSTNNIPAQNQQPTAFMPQQQQQQYFAAFQAVHPQQQQSYDAWMSAYQNYMNQMAQYYHQMPYASAAHFPTGQPAYTFVGGAPGDAAASAQFVHPAAAAAMAPAHFNAQHQQHQMMVVPQQQHHHEQQQQGMAENAPAQQRMGAAAFGGAVQADLLDIVYKSVRFALLAMVLYVYSSLERFFLVLAVVAFFWFVHRRRNQQQRDNAAAAAMANVGDGQPQQQQNAGVDDGGDVANGRPEAAPAVAEEAAIVEQRVEAVQASPPVAVVPQQPSAWNVFFTVVQSFFTSLVPNPMPAPVDIN